MAATGETGEEIAAGLEVSPATVYNWRRRRRHGSDTTTKPQKLREQNARLKRLFAEAEFVNGRVMRVGQRKVLTPAAKAPRRGHAHGHIENAGTVGAQSSWAARVHVLTTVSGCDTG
ncbi:transposase [Mycolicibacterium sp. CH28]|uniref:transposase n=1 Tax=Mycolicibacterium sp. CH28 TaxID=2512237 RepID=UPI001386753E